MTLLITGGAGFVGSHFARLASDEGRRVIVLDDLSGTKDWPTLPCSIKRVHGNFADLYQVSNLIVSNAVTAVVHFGGKICVGESVANPALYYEHNIVQALALLDVVRVHGPRIFVFSSSAAVYGLSNGALREENAPVPVNPYGETK